MTLVVPLAACTRASSPSSDVVDDRDAAPAAPPPARLAVSVLEGEVFASGWRVEGRIASETDGTVAARRAVEAAFVDVDRWFSAWRPDSHIVECNRRESGLPCAFHVEAVAVIERCHRVGTETGGAFDITVGPLLELWGFSAKTKGLSVSEPTEHELTAARRRVGIDLVGVEGGFVVRRAPAVIIDVTAVTDAAAAAHALRALRDQGVSDALVDVAGEVVVVGGPYVVGIEVPGAASNVVAAVVARARLAPDVGETLALSTSGTTRDVRAGPDGARRSHIIDPRSGRPAALTLASCTVTGPDVVVADALSTACIVLGEAESRAVFARLGYEGLFISADGRVTTTAAFPLVTE